MSFQVMLQQLTTGFGSTLVIFFLTLLFSLPLGMVVYFGRVSRFKPLSWIGESLYFYYERNTADAAAAFVVFRTVLPLGNEYRGVQIYQRSSLDVL